MAERIGATVVNTPATRRSLRTAGTRCPPSRRPNLILHLINKPPKITQGQHFPDTY
jgi:hypothetical protein